MKRLFFILVAALMTASVMGEVTIPQNFNGVRLGKSSHKDVDKILTANGLVFNAERSDSMNFVYEGNCKHEDMEFDGMVTRFTGDTLIYVAFYGNCDSACVDYGKSFIQGIHSKYEELPAADSSFTYLLLTADADSMGLAKWGRGDGNTLVITMNNDKKCICMYYSESFLISYWANALLETIRAASPDFAEENKVTGVAGVKFGDSRENVRRVISAKSQELLESDSHSLKYYKVKIGGVTYDYATFYFTADKGLISVNLQKPFHSWRQEEAEMAYKDIISQYKRKYTNFKVLKDEPESKASACGAYIDDYDYKPILITFRKSLSRGGDIMYYIQVEYYYNRRSNLYDDEI